MTNQLEIAELINSLEVCLSHKLLDLLGGLVLPTLRISSPETMTKR